MKNKRREFVKYTGIAGIGIAGGLLNSFAVAADNNHFPNQNSPVKNMSPDKNNISIIGVYGAWAASLTENKIPSLSFRKQEFTNLQVWKKEARKRLKDRLSIPAMGLTPQVNAKRKFQYDGLDIEELSWQLPYGPPTDAILLKPANTKEKLPGILAFHDHGGQKYFGTKKLPRSPTRCIR